MRLRAGGPVEDPAAPASATEGERRTADAPVAGTSAAERGQGPDSAAHGAAQQRASEGLVHAALGPGSGGEGGAGAPRPAAHAAERGSGAAGEDSAEAGEKRAGAALPAQAADAAGDAAAAESAAPAAAQRGADAAPPGDTARTQAKATDTRL